MIRVEEYIIEQEHFGDGTLKLNTNFIDCLHNSDEIDITWCYDNDGELFTLFNIVETIRDVNSRAVLFLYLPYIPNARQDRRASNRAFTLKTFAKIINSMNFYKVYVLDPHSDVSTALIDRVNKMTSLHESINFLGTNTTIMFPDAGAAKKYNVPNAIIGNKHRNEQGKIDKYELLNFVDGTEEVIIVDDICSYGGTFVAAAKELRKRGVKHIRLIVSHCENHILDGEVMDYVDEVFTTDSICTIDHPKICKVIKFR